MVTQTIEKLNGPPYYPARKKKSYDLARQFNLTTRTLQRLFSRYVGVSPSWVSGRVSQVERA